MSTLPPLRLPATLHPVTSPLEPKLKHWIRTTSAGHPPRTAQLPPSTAIKISSQPLITLLTTQLCLHFASSLARAPRHQSSTRRCYSLSLLSHTHCPSAQWHPRWWTSQPSFTSWIAYRHVNSRKKYFKIPQHRAGLTTSSVKFVLPFLHVTKCHNKWSYTIVVPRFSSNKFNLIPWMDIKYAIWLNIILP
jgi:hypothetical protein